MATANRAFETIYNATVGGRHDVDIRAFGARFRETFGGQKDLLTVTWTHRVGNSIWPYGFPALQYKADAQIFLTLVQNQEFPRWLVKMGITSS